MLFQETGLLDRTEYTQPALFSLEYALAELWQSWGIRPDLVLGHSVGEYVAACVAGVFSLEDGLKLIAERGRLMGALPAGGAMVAVFADEARVQPVLAAHRDRVTLAALNGPGNTVISGDADAVAIVLAALAQKGIRCVPLAVSHAFHSPLLEPMLDAFERVAAGVKYAPPQIALVSNLTGRRRNEAPDAAYWRAHARQPVRFADGVRAVAEQGALLVEIGPQPVLTGLAKQCVPESVGLRSLARGSDDWATAMNSLAQLYVAGAAVDWPAFDRDYPRCRVSLPTYPFQRERYWVEDAPGVSAAPAEPRPKHAVADVYDSFVSSGFGSSFLTFGLLDEVVPGFAWLPAMVCPEKYPDDAALLLKTQTALRDLLFADADFPAAARVLDFGCGLAADLVRLAERYPHLRLEGCTLSPGQAAEGRQKLRARGLEDRVNILNQDSATTAFPGKYDVIFGFEVAHHVPDKTRLFGNLQRICLSAASSSWPISSRFSTSPSSTMKPRPSSSRRKNGRRC